MEDVLQRITFDKDVLGGKPVIRGLRISVEMILEVLAKGATRQELLEDYPELGPEDVDVSNERGIGNRAHAYPRGSRPHPICGIITHRRPDVRADAARRRRRLFRAARRGPGNDVDRGTSRADRYAVLSFKRCYVEQTTWSQRFL